MQMAWRLAPWVAHSEQVALLQASRGFVEISQLFENTVHDTESKCYEYQQLYSNTFTHYLTEHA